MSLNVGEYSVLVFWYKSRVNGVYISSLLPFVL